MADKWNPFVPIAVAVRLAQSLPSENMLGADEPHDVIHMAHHAVRAAARGWISPEPGMVHHAHRTSSLRNRANLVIIQTSPMR